MVRGGRRHHEIAIEEEESLGRADAFMRFLRTNESRHWERDETRREL
jgi:hypothetical protein